MPVVVEEALRPEYEKVEPIKGGRTRWRDHLEGRWEEHERWECPGPPSGGGNGVGEAKEEARTAKVLPLKREKLRLLYYGEEEPVGEEQREGR